MNVVIVAGGLQTRFKELSCFPKVLLPSDDGRPILMRQYDYFDGLNSVTLVVNKKFKDIVQRYVEVNHLDIEVVSSNNTNGSGNTLSSVYTKIPHKNVLFFWSDILFDDDKFEIDKECYGENDCVIFTTKDKCYRYAVENSKIINKSVSYDGNVPGIFYMKNIEEIIPSTPSEENLDLVDLIKKKSDEGMISLVGSEIDAKIVEYKSIEDYKKIIESSKVHETVFPTDVHVSYDDDESIFITSESTRMDNRILFWEKFSNVMNLTVNCGSFAYPISHEINGLNHYNVGMNSLEGYDKFDYKDPKQCERLIDLANQMSRNFIGVRIGMSVQFILKECCGKPVEECSSLSKMLLNYDFNRLQSLVDKMTDIVLSESDLSSFVLTHGNINSSNIFYNPSSDDLVVINPVARYKDTAYAPQWVDDADLMITLLGIDDKLRQPIIQVDYPFTYELDHSDALTRAVVILRLLTMITWFKDDIIKVNAIYNWCISEATKLVGDYDFCE